MRILTTEKSPTENPVNTRQFWACPELSIKAKALYAYFMAVSPEGFVPRVAQVQAEMRIGRECRQAAYRELRKAGLLDTRYGTFSVTGRKGGAS